MTFFQKNNMFTHLIQSDVNFESMDTDDHDSDLSSTESQCSGRMADALTPSYTEYSVAQLRELLRQRGQWTTGSRSALKKRLKTLDRQTAAAKANSTSSTTTTTTTTAAAATSTAAAATTTTAALLENNKHSKERSGSIIMEMSLSEKDQQSVCRPRRAPSRSNSFSAHFSDFIKRRRDALETQRQEISVYTSPLTVLSYFVLYLLHEFRMALLWIVSRQYLLVIMPALAGLVYILYQTD
ncbi:hypothetical protein DFQ26_005785, partial [Actinomortierella ambigua]